MVVAREITSKGKGEEEREPTLTLKMYHRGDS